VPGTHPRNTKPMHESPRCGAKTRKGTPCQAPAVAGKSRCRMHGGAAGSGAPKGNKNAFKHGLYTAEAKGMRRHIRELQRRTREIIDEM
jgi:uncharacterized protein YjcR